MYLTKRERELNAVREQAEEDFSDNKLNDDRYKDDPTLRTLYLKSWREAETDYYRFYNSYSS